VPEIQAINIYDPDDPAQSIREKSQIFIRFFEANEFLTLSSVRILSREATKLNNHDAVRYEIEKKAGLPNFPHQPSWRSKRHRLIDVRLNSNGPSIFFVNAANPQLNETIFENYLASLIFDNDRASFTEPLEEIAKRPILKPFGMFVSPEKSPVSPERFQGFHTGFDFESLETESEKEISFFAICGGPLKEKRTANGYGGLLIQECFLETQALSIIYGHIALSSVAKATDAYVIPGEKLGMLGAAYSKETDGERRHLHLGIFKGSKSDIRGYIPAKEGLESWLNPVDVLGIE